MSLISINQDNIERYELVANPKVFFASSSLGTTGSLKLFSDGSSTLKDVFESPGLYVEGESVANDNDVESHRSAAKKGIQ